MNRNRRPVAPALAAEVVREFHETFGLPVADTPQMAGIGLARQRHQMFLSEVSELGSAVLEGDLPGIAQELADVVYVAYGTALTYGIDLDAVIAEVHAANMTKLGADGKPIMMDGKVQKGPYYMRPDVARVLARQGVEPEEFFGEGPNHLLVVVTPEISDIGGPAVMYELDHPAECDRLPYGQRCSLDELGRDRTGWPEMPGEYTIWSWSSKEWTDSGWEFDSGVYWERVPEEPAQEGAADVRADVP